MSETLTPVFRLEYFITAAANGTPCDLEPIFNEEKYLHAIAGASVDLPMPVGRTQEYLAKLAGMDVEIPNHPIFRTEYYLAHMIDSTVECPAPIFREEMFYYEWASSEYVTIVGNPVSFTAIAAPLKQLEVAFSPVQDLHGYDSPWPAGGGKNLIPDGTDTDNGYRSNAYIGDTGSLTASNNWYVSEYFAVTAGATYTLSSNSTTVSNPSVCFYDSNKEYLSGIAYGDNIRPYTFTAPENAVYARASQGINFATNGTQIEAGSTASAVTPYRNLCPISGWDGVEIYDDPLYAGVIEWNQRGLPKQNYSRNGIQSVRNADESASLSGTTTASFSDNFEALTITQGHKYYQRLNIIANPNNVSFTFGSLNGGGMSVLSPTSREAIVTATESRDVTVGIYGLPVGVSVDEMVLQYMVTDLTAMFGAGNEPATVEDFKALFPHDYYPYNAGTETTVGAVNGMETRSISISFGSTVYSGTLDLLTGVVTVTKEKYVFPSAENWTLYQSSFFYTGLVLPHDAVSGDVVAENGVVVVPNGKQVRVYIASNPDYVDASTDMATLMNGIGIVYTLRGPITIQLTPEQVSSLAGENVAWASTNGDLEITYRSA